MAKKKKAAKTSKRGRGKAAKNAAKRDAAKPVAPERLEDFKLAAAAIARQDAGLDLTVRERAALRRVVKLLAGRAAADAYRAVPKKLWVQWSGRQHQQIAEQAARHNLPLAGASIDLEQLAPAVHELLARRDAGDKKQRRAGRALELIRREELLLKRMERLARQRVLLERASVHDCFGLVADIVRKAGAALLDQFGADAHAILDDALEEAVRLVDSITTDGPDVEH